MILELWRVFFRLCLKAKGLLRSIDHVEEAIFVLFTLEQLCHGHGDAGHGALVDKQEECLVRVELHAASAKTKITNLMCT